MVAVDILPSRGRSEGKLIGGVADHGSVALVMCPEAVDECPSAEGKSAGDAGQNPGRGARKARERMEIENIDGGRDKILSHRQMRPSLVYTVGRSLTPKITLAKRHMAWFTERVWPPDSRSIASVVMVSTCILPRLLSKPQLQMS